MKDENKRVIFHVDVNSAFLSWEAAYRLHHLGGKLDIRKIPSAVGGDISKRHGIILAKSIPAKKYNIQTGEPVTDALKKCPGLYLVPPNYSLYEKNSNAMMEILREYSPAVEIYSIDEAFVDMTGIQVVSVSLRYYDFSHVSHQRKLDEPTDVTNEIYAAACQIFSEVWNGWSIRHIGIHTSGVSEQGGYRQISLFEDAKKDHDKLSKMDKAVDEIRKKFGADAVKRAVFLGDDRIDHLSGGISREKRTVDYSKQDVQ